MTKPIQVKNMSLGEGIPKICVPITGKTEEAVSYTHLDVYKRQGILIM